MYVKAMSVLLSQIAKKDDIKIKTLSLPKIKLVPDSMQSLMRSIIDNYDSRIIHNLIDCVLPKLNKKIVITTAHEFRELILPYSDLKKKTFKENLYYHFLKNNTQRILSSDIIIANSSQTRDEALKLGFDNKKIKKICCKSWNRKKFIFDKPIHYKNKVFIVYGQVSENKIVSIMILLMLLFSRPTLFYPEGKKNLGVDIKYIRKILDNKKIAKIQVF